MLLHRKARKKILQGGPIHNRKLMFFVTSPGMLYHAENLENKLKYVSKMYPCV